MTAGRHDREIKGRIVALTTEENGKWHPYFGGIVDLVGAFCVMTSHGRIWDYRRNPGWRKGVVARDNRKFFKAFMSRGRKVILGGTLGRLYPDGTFVAHDGRRCFVRGAI
jgi:hypothetical protein